MTGWRKSLEPPIKADERLARRVGAADERRLTPMRGRIDVDRRKLDEVTRAIIGCAYRVSNALGAGFLEKVYENALAHELGRIGLHVSRQAPIEVLYDGVVVGQYFADILVAGCVIVELKAAKGSDDVHVAQCLNYLKATGLQVCLLMNFSEPRVQIRRVVREF